MPVLFTTLLLAAALPVVKALLLSCVGAYAAMKGILTLDGRRTVSALIIQVFLPCYFFSNLAAGVSLTDAVRLWPITINMLLTHVLGFSLGWVVVRVIQPPADFRRHVTVANAVGNTGNYPLVLIASLASDPSLTLFSGLKSPDLLGIQYIVLGSFIASLIQFPVIFGMLSKRAPEAAAATAAAQPQLQPQLQPRGLAVAGHLAPVPLAALEEALPLLSPSAGPHELQVITHPERLGKTPSAVSLSDQTAVSDSDAEPLLSSSDACSSSSIPHSPPHPLSAPLHSTNATIHTFTSHGRLQNSDTLRDSSSPGNGLDSNLPANKDGNTAHGFSNQGQQQQQQQQEQPVSTVQRAVDHVRSTAARVAWEVHAALPAPVQRGLGWANETWQRHKPLIDSILTVPVYACMMGLLFGSVPALRDVMFVKGGALFLVGDVINTFGALTIPCLFLVLGANLSKGPGISKLPPRLFLSLIISRQVVMPLVGTAMVMGAYSSGMLGALDPMALMVMLIIHSMPTALMVHSIATQLRNREDDVSAVLFWSYLASIITIPACIASYLYIVTRATAATAGLAATAAAVDLAVRVSS
ncbi:MAG: hypothetical protein WDW38_005661 [Sanguina aurantia]